MADLLTLSEVREFLNIHPTNTQNDAMYEALIPAVSAAVRAYTDRDFGAPLVTEQREFSYDGSGFLDIDDATDITAVSMSAAVGDDLALDPSYWKAMPTISSDSPVHTYLILPIGSPVLAVNPHMGFIRNLDIYYAEHSVPSVPSTVKVTATWGWPDIPPDVKLAALWVLTDWATASSRSDELTAESIEGWARTWGGRGGTTLAIPARSRDILALYQKSDI